MDGTTLGGVKTCTMQSPQDWGMREEARSFNSQEGIGYRIVDNHRGRKPRLILDIHEK